jgi:hypothetical protein
LEERPRVIKAQAVAKAPPEPQVEIKVLGLGPQTQSNIQVLKKQAEIAQDMIQKLILAYSEASGIAGDYTLSDDCTKVIFTIPKEV